MGIVIGQLEKIFVKWHLSTIYVPLGILVPDTPALPLVTGAPIYFGLMGE
jgi:hypothetical protein